MIILDAFFRFSGIGMLLLLVVFAIRDHRKWQSAPYLIAASVSTACLFFGYSPISLKPSGWFLALVRFGDIPHLVFVWLFALSLFKTNFKLSYTYVAFSIAYCAPILWLRLSDYGIGPLPPKFLPIFSLSSLFIVGHLCIVLLKGRNDDLSAARRKSRLYFVSLILLVTVVATLSDLLLNSQTIVPISSIKIMSIWPVILAGIFWMIRFDQEAVCFDSKPSLENKLSIKDKLLSVRLHEEMIENEAYKDAKLSIPVLANRVGVTQHRLRSLINTSLGFQNFSQYVNGFRLTASKTAFADPHKKHLPILTIALDCGFRSISPFNRAFKIQEGVTPSEYIQKLYADHDKK